MKDVLLMERMELFVIQASAEDFFRIDSKGRSFCQIFGTMMDIPLGWPHYIRDLQYLLDEQGIDDSDLPAQEGAAHNALEDAKYIKQLWEFLNK